MAIQELDVRILHRSGKHNANADALSTVPLEQSELHQEDKGKMVGAITATTELAELQSKDEGLKQIIDFQESGILPSEEKQAELISLTQSRYMLVENVLHYVNPDGSLRVIPPNSK